VYASIFLFSSLALSLDPSFLSHLNLVLSPHHPIQWQLAQSRQRHQESASRHVTLPSPASPRPRYRIEQREAVQCCVTNTRSERVILLHILLRMFLHALSVALSLLGCVCLSFSLPPPNVLYKCMRQIRCCLLECLPIFLRSCSLSVCQYPCPMSISHPRARACSSPSPFLRLHDLLVHSLSPSFFFVAFQNALSIIFVCIKDVTHSRTSTEPLSFLRHH